MRKRINNILRYCHILILLTSPLLLIGQTRPLWIDGDVRNLQFPNETYYTGFSEISVNDGDFTKATERAKRNALGELSERVIISVNTEKKSQITSEEESEQPEKIRSIFVARISTNSKTDIIGSTLETYTDKVTKDVFAFVRVKKSDLFIYYKNQIDKNLNRIDSDLLEVESLISAGKKMSAQRKIENIQNTLSDISYFQDIIIAINANENALQTQRTSLLLQQVNQRLISIKQSTSIFMNCLWKGDETENPNLICGIIAQALSENNCTITDSQYEADYELRLTASTMQRSDISKKNGIISYYANLQGSLYNYRTMTKTVEFNIINDVDCYAVGRNGQDAIVKAFLLPELKEKILKKIMLYLND